ncbi:nose resistant to fluoxetine protein 6 [Procambarus clarkii]|uniref:nose resistant to fluoxetine protein 6 n=1 Tax=Procambarus clarkii TaxID=6728 RepID=UPI0037447D0A
MCSMLLRDNKAAWVVASVVLSATTCRCLHAQDWHLQSAREWLSVRKSTWWPLYMPSGVDETSPCGQSLTAMRHSLELNETWALKMVDSWGKSVDGILYGTKATVGVFDECVAAKSLDKSIHGKYCLISLRHETVSDNLDTKDHNSWTRGSNLYVVPSVINYNWQLNGSGFQYATCMPDACSAEELQESLIETYSNSTIKYVVNSVACQPNDSQNKFSAGDIVYITLLSVLFFTILVAGLVDAYIEKTNNKTMAKGALRYLLPFSVYTNMRKLFHLNTDHSPDSINCLHGIKVLSMTWVVFGHQHIVTMLFEANLLGMWTKMDSFFDQIANNAFPSVDTFFFVGGVLLSLSVLKQLKKNGRFNIIQFYIHRIIRLVPSIALVAGLYATIVHFFVSGPIASYWNVMQRTCQLTWWRDILFIDNFVLDPIEPGTQGDCLGQCWYLAVDTQFYLISPLILLPLYFYSGIGEVLLYVLSLVSVIIPAAIIYAYDFPPFNLLLDPKTNDYMLKVYLTPWCRAGPWLVGLWLGYVFYTRGNKKAILTKWQVVAGWTVATITGILIVFGMWSYNTIPRKAQYDVITQVVYGGGQRFTWGAVMAWVVFACHYGYGGLVNEFLSHPIWQPMSRLTYSLYLVAYPLQFAIVFNTRTLYYYNYFNKIIETVGVLVISGIIATLVSLCVESPIIGLEKVLLGRPDSRSNDPIIRGSKLSENGTESKLSGNGRESQPSGHDNYSFITEMTEITEDNGTCSENVTVDNVTKL